MPVLVTLALLKNPSTVIYVDVLFTLTVWTWLFWVNIVLKELPFCSAVTCMLHNAASE